MSERDELGYATRLAESLWRQYYKADAPDWRPLDTVAGVLTQIDNMVSGMARATPTQAVPALTEAMVNKVLRNYVDVDRASSDNIAHDLRLEMAAAPQPSPEPKEPEHAHDWRFSLQDHLYKCDCGATRGDYPFGAASFKD